ncbi:MAG TPA: amylo-alpha-1,6-glucosidase [Gemmatimonadales bacterium]|jgi:predicted glycogen debranching enzyme|nr:amylo-alpha-1,6-glucosidase [Gemmatimonadales bacterium]
MIPAPTEWLEADGLGGFASGTVAGPRARRYHALLNVALTPPTSRVVLVNGFDAWIERPGLRGARGEPRREFLTAQRYTPDVTTKAAPLVRFSGEPWPSWTWRLADGTEVTGELVVPRGVAAVALRWRAEQAAPGLRLVVRPFLSGRDLHALHSRNAALSTEADVAPERVRWQTYPSLPAVLSLSNGSYVHAPVWYRNFQLDLERARGFEFTEDLLSPGLIGFDLSCSPAVWLLGAEGLEGVEEVLAVRPLDAWRAVERLERGRRARFASPLHRAADGYLVSRGAGKTIIAGYPWFTDWGRDTFIALRGLCLATGRVDEARQILLAWADTVSLGMLPNRFVDQGDAPEFNSVDASLWYVIAASEYLRAAERAGHRMSRPDRLALESAIQRILTGYADGTRYGIAMDEDGLLRCGVPGVQLTWMDAKVGDWVVTPRIGKPVEVQALWLNALRIGGSLDPRWAPLFERGLGSFGARFWNAERGCLYDVVDADGVSGRVDPSLRPNQIFAVGGLPFPLLEGDRAERVFEAVRGALLTPLGLRTLAPGEPGYSPRYEGGPRERDGAYHQGTVWPWLIGAFAEAWLRVQGDTAVVRAEVRRTCVEPLLRHLEEAGLGHVSEIADAEPPHTPRGCPFQAWSVGELLRITSRLDAADAIEAAETGSAPRLPRFGVPEPAAAPARGGEKVRA